MAFRGEGPVQFQARRGPMSLAADRDVDMASVNRRLNLSAAREVIFECGGAFAQFKDGNITLGGPGNLFFKSSRSRKNSLRRCISPCHRSWLKPCHS
ncbi:DUF2345 domain-containing protein [Paraburkholderia sp. DD10]|jgi:type VI secretion system secreted protein VgrG|uniref:DUF2345 domain-containing protein n=1 Tax=Paraburkholderia sp. DD10 TaxID=3409691 RepID=UPI003BA3D962